MPGTPSKLTLASALRDGFADLPGGLAMQYLGDALKKCIDDPGLSWSASVAAIRGLVPAGIDVQLNVLIPFSVSELHREPQ